jgi:predicted nucleotidyltransferase
MLLDKKAIAILGEFSSDYGKRIYGRDIAKRLEMNQKTVSNVLNRLEKENILKFSVEGKNKYYYLNKFNPSIKEIVKLMEVDRKIKFIERNKKIGGLLENLEQRARGILIIFGSYAKGTNTEKSDLDVFVQGRISNIDDLENLYSLKINVILSDKKRFDKQEKIIIEILKNHIILKGVEEFIESAWQA